MSDPILVTGGTGTLGSHVVPLLRKAGCDDVRVMSRTSRPSNNSAVSYVVGDLEEGVGVEAAVAGVSTILHLAGSAKGDDLKARTLVGRSQRRSVGRTWSTCPWWAPTACRSVVA